MGACRLLLSSSNLDGGSSCLRSTSAPPTADERLTCERPVTDWQFRYRRIISRTAGNTMASGEESTCTRVTRLELSRLSVRMTAAAPFADSRTMQPEKDRMDIYHKLFLVARRDHLHQNPITPNWGEPRILDLGCGTGICTWTFHSSCSVVLRKKCQGPIWNSVLSFFACAVNLTLALPHDSLTCFTYRGHRHGGVSAIELTRESMCGSTWLILDSCLQQQVPQR